MNEFWKLVENVGDPILALIGGVTFFSLNFYLRDCGYLRQMEEHLDKKRTQSNSEMISFPQLGLQI